MKISHRTIPKIVIGVGVFEIILSLLYIYFHTSFIENLIKMHLLSNYLGPMDNLTYGILLLFDSIGLRKRTAGSWYLGIIINAYFLIMNIVRTPSFIPASAVSISLSLFILILLILYRKKFIYPSLLRLPNETLIALITIIFTVIYGMAGSLFLGNQFQPPIKDPLNAFYYTIEVMTTLGFGDILPLTGIAKLFTSSVVILGVGSFFGMVSTLMGPIVERRMKGVLNIMEVMEFSKMSDHTVFCGYTSLVYEIMKEYKKKDIPFIAIVRDEENANMLKYEGFLVIKGRADSIETLEKAQIKKAREVIISSGDDPYNLVVALTLNKLKREWNLKYKVRLIVSSSKNIETIKDFVDEIIDISKVLKDYMAKSIQN